jgi:TolA-binding protein
VVGSSVSSERCREVFQRSPREPLTADVLLSLGDSANAENRYRQAADCYRRILKQFPESSHCAAARLKLGQALLAKHTGKTPKRIAKDTDRDYFMSASEAVEYGLIDRIIVPSK